MCLLAMRPRKEGTRASLGARLLFIVLLGPVAVILGIPKNLAGKAGLAVVASIHEGLQEAD